MRNLLIICVLGLFLGACASSPETGAPQTFSWKDDLDPFTEYGMSDWEIFDVTPKSFSSNNNSMENIQFDLKEIFY